MQELNPINHSSSQPSRGRLPGPCISRLFTGGRSFDGFLPDSVSDAQMTEIWNLMRMGPTSANCLPARLVWCTSEAARARLAACVSRDNSAKVLSAPCTVIVGMDLTFYDELPSLFPHADARSWFCNNAEIAHTTAFRNSTLQGAYLIMAARAIGLDAAPMSGFDGRAVDAAFFADRPDVTTNFICALGHGDPAKLPPASPRPGFERFNIVV